MCFVWISEQTAIISLYSIKWLVFITKADRLLRGTNGILNKIQVSLSLKDWSVSIFWSSVSD
jgi:hypothetical protein